jgi:hypothetical protein
MNIVGGGTWFYRLRPITLPPRWTCVEPRHRPKSHPGVVGGEVAGRNTQNQGPTKSKSIYDAGRRRGHLDLPASAPNLASEVGWRRTSDIGRFDTLIYSSNVNSYDNSKHSRHFRPFSLHCHDSQHQEQTAVCPTDPSTEFEIITHKELNCDGLGQPMYTSRRRTTSQQDKEPEGEQNPDIDQ